MEISHRKALAARAANETLEEKMVRVLQSVAAPGSTTKFVDQVVRYAPDDIEFAYFSWREALFGSYDVLHVHWPERFTRGSSSFSTSVKRVLFRTLLFRLRRRRTAVVRTVHNLEPHSPGDAKEGGLLARLDAITTIDVALNPCTPSRGIPSVVIPHGDYSEQFPVVSRAESRPTRILFAGRIEGYKGVPELIDVVKRMAPAEVELRIVGRPTEGLRSTIEEALTSRTPAEPEVTARLDFVSDEELVEEISRATIVVLPYREMHNSGMLLVALSVGRPVLVPHSCANDAIAAEVGDRWVNRYGGDLAAADIRAALALASEPRESAPAFVQRSWAEVAEAYASVFRRAADLSPGARDRDRRDGS